MAMSALVLFKTKVRGTKRVSSWPILLQKSHLAVPPILIGLLGRGRLYLPRIAGG